MSAQALAYKDCRHCGAAFPPPFAAASLCKACWLEELHERHREEGAARVLDDLTAYVEQHPGPASTVVATFRREREI